MEAPPLLKVDTMQHSARLIQLLAEAEAIATAREDNTILTSDVLLALCNGIDGQAETVLATAFGTGWRDKVRTAAANLGLTDQRKE